ncbi:putative sugar nucleotidyl transferase [Sediminibacterium ginsengisoli]|uniref:UDP-N-acetylglucosamine diphosphorylase/glucosamine-1-phosphate N-acetyltransferase n=1 Tax=Sediminibacterium ginsengisoli TaxID=413434 RepID=A0A1T4PQJ4_9BACT|nr:putative sugar nucleotidyl transferase [Sediminibacterium ginsengisoli]SJZ93830.1 UDP-N-acetylglucosamine diphosphorylase/glucosamine-1-phosphate N-acetyltransferase [Sediminibacterium ginsengisoli]
MALILFCNASRERLYPFTQTRATGSLRMGIFTVAERWAHICREEVFLHTTGLLQPLYPLPETQNPQLWIDATIIPDAELLDAIAGLTEGECLADKHGFIAGRAVIPFGDFDGASPLQFFQTVKDFRETDRIRYPWELAQWNDRLLRYDFALITANRQSRQLSSSNRLIAPENIFVEDGAEVECCNINASAGPVYIGRNAVIMEGSSIRGPFAMCDHSVLKLNSRVYGATTLGPYCMGGGEIKNSILMGYSNKAHDGYLGDAVIGEWCNLGAGTTCSNVKNTGGIVQVWDRYSGAYVAAGPKAGMIMGDYSRTAINTAINTGSVIGVCCHVAGPGLQPKVIADFSWAGSHERYDIEKALRDIANWKNMKQQQLGATEASVLKQLYGTPEQQS